MLNQVQIPIINNPIAYLSQVMSQKISYSQLVSILLKQINKFRQDPRSFLPILNKRVDQYKDKFYHQDGGPIRILTEEGVKPVKEVINTLVGLDRLPKFVWSYEVHCAANQRARMLTKIQQGVKPDISYSNLDDLIPKVIQCSGQVSQHFIYGYCDPVDIIANLLIDDGHPQRQNRQSLLNPGLQYMGIGVEYHPKYMFVVVIVMVANIEAVQKHNDKGKVGKVEKTGSFHIFDHPGGHGQRGVHPSMPGLANANHQPQIMVEGHRGQQNFGNGGGSNCQNCHIF